MASLRNQDERRRRRLNSGTVTALGHEDWLSKLSGKVTPMPNGCWRCGPVPTTYTRVIIGGVSEPVHRAVYAEMVGDIPEGHHVHHKCEMPACINPAHLEALSPADHSAAHVALRRVS